MAHTLSIDEAAAHPLVRETLAHASKTLDLVGPLYPVGRGRSTVVFKAKDASGQVLALKIPSYGACASGDLPRLRTSLRKEASILSTVRSSATPQLVYFAREGRYLAREFVEGVPLQKAVKGMDDRAVLCLLACLVVSTRRLFEAFHDHPVEPYVVNGLKPSNLLYHDTRGVILVDVGSSRPERHVALRKAGPSSYLGKAKNGFWSPERLLNDAQTYGRHTDYFSFGALAYFLVTGKAPFSNTEKDPDLALQKYMAEYPGVIQRAQTALQALSLTPDVIDFVVRCLHPIAAKRPNGFFEADIPPARNRLLWWVQRRFRNR